MGLRSITPRRVRRAAIARLSKYSIHFFNAMGSAPRLTCNVCMKRTAAFFDFEGRPFGCPHCGSSSRERFVLAAIKNGLIAGPPSGGRTLHVAPSELSLLREFRSAGEYVASDLIPGRYSGVEVRALDLTQLAHRREEFGIFNLVYASHVLEHIPDEQAALSAVFNSLVPGGALWVLVPLACGSTVEGSPGMSVFERERLFGQWDHVRQYGSDIVERLSRVGFSVRSFCSTELGGQVVADFGLNPEDVIFVCSKPT